MVLEELRKFESCWAHHTHPSGPFLQQADRAANFSYVLLKGGFSDGIAGGGDIGGCRSGVRADVSRGAASWRQDSKSLTAWRRSPRSVRLVQCGVDSWMPGPAADGGPTRPGHPDDVNALRIPAGSSQTLFSIVQRPSAREPRCFHAATIWRTMTRDRCQGGWTARSCGCDAGRASLARKGNF